jgi:hypothetical protein
MICSSVIPYYLRQLITAVPEPCFYGIMGIVLEIMIMLHDDTA